MAASQTKRAAEIELPLSPEPDRLGRLREHLAQTRCSV